MVTELEERIADVEAKLEQALNVAMAHGDQHWAEGTDPIQRRVQTGTGMPTHDTDEGTFYWDTDARLMWVSVGAGVWRPQLAFSSEIDLIADEWSAITPGWVTQGTTHQVGIVRIEAQPLAAAWIFNPLFFQIVGLSKEINMMFGMRNGTSSLSKQHTRIGMGTGVGAGPFSLDGDVEFTSGCYFRNGIDGNTNWWVVTRNAASDIATADTGVSANDGNLKNFHIRKADPTTTTDYEFRIDDKLVASIAGDATGFYLPFFQVVATNSVKRDIELDYSHIFHSRNYPSSP